MALFDNLEEKGLLNLKNFNFFFISLQNLILIIQRNFKVSVAHFLKLSQNFNTLVAQFKINNLCSKFQFFNLVVLTGFYRNSVAQF